MGPKIVAQNYDAGFFITHFIKDMRLAQANSPVDLKMLQTVLAMYEKLSVDGLDRDGSQALIKYYHNKE